MTDSEGKIEQPERIIWRLDGWNYPNPELVRSDGYRVSVRFHEYTPDNKGKFAPFNYSKSYWCNQLKDTSAPHKAIMDGIVSDLNEIPALRRELEETKKELANRIHTELDACERARQAESELARLREALEKIWDITFNSTRLTEGMDIAEIQFAARAALDAGATTSGEPK